VVLALEAEAEVVEGDVVGKGDLVGLPCRYYYLHAYVERGDDHRYCHHHEDHLLVS